MLDNLANIPKLQRQQKAVWPEFSWETEQGGNKLKNENILTWNVWFTAPELVNQQEQEEHAEKWRTFIDAYHGTPGGPGTEARHFDGTPFEH